MLNRGSRYGPMARVVSTAELTDASFAEESAWLPSGHRERRQLEISVVHASLEQASNPVIVGHYRGIPAAGAEQFLDEKLDRRLTDAYELGQYPEEVGQSLVALPPETRPPGGIVVGLGSFGELTVAKLARSVADAATELIRRYAVQGRHGDVGISSVLVGSPGHHDLTIDQSIQAITTAVLRAIQRSDRIDASRPDANPRPRITRLEFVEFYGDKADEALTSVREVGERLPPDVLGEIELSVRDVVEVREGGLEQTARRGQGDPVWLRYRITRPDGLDAKARAGVSPIEISAEGRAARTALETVRIDFAKLNGKLAGDRRDQKWRQSVLADLIPPALREEFAQTDNLHLRLDQELARIPWEMLADRGDGASSQALSLRAGVVREFIDREPTTFAHAPGPTRRALVIGDPATGKDYPPLAGAAREAHLVADLLERAGYEVDRLIGDRADWLSVDVALKSADVSIVHIAAHGQLVEDNPDETGIVLDDGQLIKAVDFEKIAKPDLVFLNACHVGSTAGRLVLDRPEQFAANFAVSLFQTDVRAVVAAGWAVEDRAAMQFAQTFYERLLDHTPFGRATQYARAAAFQAGGSDSLTWAAYQCYGKPGFVLPGKPVGAPSRHRRYVSARDLRLEVARLANRANISRDLAPIEEMIVAAEQAYRGELEQGDHQRGLTLELFGNAYRAIDRFDEAIRSYDAALKDTGSTATIRTIERRANVRSRHAVKMIRNPPVDGAPTWGEIERMLGVSLRELDALDTLGPSAERLILRSGHYRRAAYARRHVGYKHENDRSTLAELLNKSIEASLQAFELDPDVYQLSGAVASWALLTRAEQDARDDPEELDWFNQRLADLTDEHEERAETERAGSWGEQDLANARLCQLLLDPSSEDDELNEQVIADLYTSAWDVRSNAAQRRSTLDHVRLLADLASNTTLIRRMRALADCLEESGAAAHETN